MYFYRKAKKFLKFVSKEPALWDVDHPGYKDIELKHAKWKEIADEFLIPYKEAMSRFKSMRDKYRREKRHLVEKPGVKREPWDLMEDLAFLDNVRPRNPRSAILDDIPPAPISRPPNYIPPTTIPPSGHATRLSTGTLRQPSYVELPLPALTPRPPPPAPTPQKAQTQNNYSNTVGHNNTSQSASYRKHPTPPPLHVKPESNNSSSRKMHSSPPPHSPPAKVRKVSLGGFIDQMVDQEPDLFRERFSLEILDAVVKIKRQFIDERQNNGI